ncbi:MAG: RnfABCDGE type electron transport complex subunit A [Chitinispirillia bacterium]|nr:RnfABCDGE type electron transport complex subunit A [Chitinispirillia bacterium]MCL2242188.1 RnfABCDGE type electron transport complex subunit A [Chitinispirillia bacterium]
MTDFVTIVQISIGAVLIQNFVLARFLGLCPFLGVSRKLSSATGMGMAVMFVMTIASMCIWWVDQTILIAMHEEFLRTIVFILIIASLVQLMELVMQKFTPALYESLGIYLPLAATNCAILGVVIINTGANPYTGEAFTFIEATVNGAAAGLGFLLALVLMAGLRERLDLADVPKAMEGFPIAFITAGLMALAFLGFSGLSFFPGTGG